MSSGKSQRNMALRSNTAAIRRRKCELLVAVSFPSSMRIFGFAHIRRSVSAMVAIEVLRWSRGITISLRFVGASNARQMGPWVLTVRSLNPSTALAKKYVDSRHLSRKEMRISSSSRRDAPTGRIKPGGMDIRFVTRRRTFNLHDPPEGGPGSQPRGRGR